MKEKIMKMFEKNNKKEELLQKTREERKKIIDEKKEIINNFKKILESNTRKINIIENNKINGRCSFSIAEQEKELRKKIEDASEEIRCERQGKIKDIISTIFGQWDKKIHNFIFLDKRKDGKEPVFRNRLWNLHKDEIENRYDNMNSVIKRNAVLLGCFVIAGFLFQQGGLLMLRNILFGASSVFIIENAIKIISTKFNLNKFGRHPKLERIKRLFNGNYKDNIKTAIIANERSIALNNKAQKLQNEIIPTTIESKKNNVEILNDLKKEETNIIEKKEFITKPNMDDYANLTIGKVTDDNNLTFNDAVSIVRNKNLSYDEKIDAYAKLAIIFGKINKTKNNENVARELNDFNKTEKLLAQYGRMINLRKKELINNGLSIENDKLLKQYTNRYLELMYHLGNVNDDYSYEDFIADEALRYAEDLKEYNENEKIMKKAI